MAKVLEVEIGDFFFHSNRCDCCGMRPEGGLALCYSDYDLDYGHGEIEFSVCENCLEKPECSTKVLEQEATRLEKLAWEIRDVQIKMPSRAEFDRAQEARRKLNAKAA